MRDVLNALASCEVDVSLAEVAEARAVLDAPAAMTCLIMCPPDIDINATDAVVREVA